MKRINICGVDYRVPRGVAEYLSEMADEIARLRAEIVRLTSVPADSPTSAAASDTAQRPASG